MLKRILKLKLALAAIIIAAASTFRLAHWWFGRHRPYTAASRHDDFKSWLARTFGIGTTTLEKYEQEGSTMKDLEDALEDDGYTFDVEERKDPDWSNS